ncbi:MAG: hypothetical protein ACK5HE_11025 [Bacteroidota bacterium]|jgi:hypothetical protein
MKNYKIIEDMENPSEDEINAQKNFSQVKQKSMRMKKQKIFKTGAIIVSACAAIIAAVVMLNNEPIKSKPVIVEKLKIEGVAFAGFEINTDKDTFIVSDRGSLITIPKNAFIDSLGNEVTGKVNLSYREFHHPAEIILSRIPMTYDSAGTRYHFESAGMFEIDAKQNGKKLRIAAGKSIAVNLASLDTAQTKFNQYYMGNTNESWQYMGKDVQWQMPKDVLNQPAVADTPRYVQPKLFNEEKQQFKIYADISEFPELSNLRDVVFELSDREKNFKPSPYNTYWDFIELERSDVFGEYKVTLYKGDETTVVLTQPVIKSMNDVIDAGINRMAKDKELYYGVSSVSRSYLSKKLQQEQTVAAAMMERYNNFTEVMAPFDITTAVASNYVYRTFQVKNLGIYNSDCPEMLPQPARLAAQFKYENGKFVNVSNVFLVEHSRNAVFTFYPGDEIQYNPEVENSLVILTENDEVALLSKEKFDEVKGKTNQYTFTPEFTTTNSGKLEALLKKL